MASEICNALTNNVTSRKCLVPGGIKTKAWIGQISDFTGVETFNTGKALSSFGLATGAKLITAIGRAKKGSGTNKLTKPEDGAVSVEQAVILEIAYNDQEEADAIMAFLRAEAKTVFLETNAGTIRQYFAEYGDSTMEGEDGTGLLIADAANVLKVTLKGTESNLPRFFEAVITGGTSQIAASRAYLDALTV